MKDIFAQIVSEFRSAWRYRWAALAAAWAVCIIGWAVVFILPDEYEAESIFFIGKTRLDEVLDQGGDDRSLIAKVRQQMLLTPVLEKVARDTDLDLRATTPQELDELISDLAQDIKIDPLRSGRTRPGVETIFRIRYRDVDRNMSLRVVDRLLDTFREDVVSGRATGSDDALEFLVSGIAEYGAMLSKQEQALADFKRKNVGLLPGEGRGYFDTLQAASESSRQMQAELSVLLDRRTALGRQLQGENPILPDEASSVGRGMPQNDVDSRIIALEAEIQELLTVYTELWPDVVSARDQLAQLYQQRDKILSELSREGGANVASNNPVYQEIQIALNESDIDIAELRVRLAAARAKVNDLQEKIDIIPEIEAQLAELTRDYDQIRNVYMDMRAKYEQENLRRKRLGWDGVTFQIMEPPRVGFDPVAPMRSLFVLLVVILGLGAGGGLAFFTQQLKPVFIDSASLKKATGLPVLGSVSMIWESRHRGQRKRELWAFIGVAALILVVAALLLIFQDAGIQAGQSIRRIASL